MKKILIPFLAFLLSFSVANAQTTTTKTTKTEAKHVKKDGTPDKRYKENKTETKTETKHVKKDGTPDKRYKENK